MWIKITWCKPVFPMSQSGMKGHGGLSPSPLRSGYLLRLPFNAVLAARGSHCPLTKQVPDSAPNCFPRRPGLGCLFSCRFNISSAAICHPLNRMSLPKSLQTSFTYFLGCHREGQGRKLLSYNWQSVEQVSVHFCEHWGGGWLLHLRNFFLFSCLPCCNLVDPLSGIEALF